MSLSAEDRSSRVRTPRQVRRRRLLVAALALVLVVAGYCGWAVTTSYSLSSTVDIRASRGQVWKVLADTRSYAQWNPFITRLDGKLAVGERITVQTSKPDGSVGMSFDPTILAVDPGRELRWVGRVANLPGIFTGEHRFVLTDGPPGHVRLTQSEEFSGVLVPFAHGWLDADTGPQFTAMNKALAARVVLDSNGH